MSETQPVRFERSREPNWLASTSGNARVGPQCYLYSTPWHAVIWVHRLIDGGRPGDLLGSLKPLAMWDRPVLRRAVQL